MTPRRKQIRYAFRDRLRGQTPAGDQVYATRMITADPERHPAIIGVYTFNEEVDPQRGYEPAGTNRRLLTLVVEIVAGGGDADDRIDDLVDQVEERIASDPQLMSAGGVSEPFVESVELQDFEVGRAEETDRLLIARQSWLVTYYTVEESQEGETPSGLYVNEGEPYGREGEDDYKRILGLND